jgi:hypothetical protein
MTLKNINPTSKVKAKTWFRHFLLKEPKVTTTQMNRQLNRFGQIANQLSQQKSKFPSDPKGFPRKPWFAVRRYEIPSPGSNDSE